MSAPAFALPARDPRADRPTPGIALTARLADQDALLPPGALALLVSLHRAIEPERQARLRARRERFGGKGYDDALARGRIAQAFGRLIRRADDKGVFLMLDAACPTRLFAGLPPGTEVQRMGLAEAVELTKRFLSPDA